MKEGEGAREVWAGGWGGGVLEGLGGVELGEGRVGGEAEGTAAAEEAGVVGRGAEDIEDVPTRDTRRGRGGGPWWLGGGAGGEPSGTKNYSEFRPGRGGVGWSPAVLRKGGFGALPGKRRHGSAEGRVGGHDAAADGTGSVPNGTPKLEKYPNFPHFPRPFWAFFGIFIFCISGSLLQKNLSHGAEEKRVPDLLLRRVGWGGGLHWGDSDGPGRR